MSDSFSDVAAATDRRDIIRQELELATAAVAALNTVLARPDVIGRLYAGNEPVRRALYRQRAALAARLDRDQDAGNRFARLADPGVAGALRSAGITAAEVGAWIHACAATTTLSADIRAALEAIEIEGAQPE